MSTTNGVVVIAVNDEFASVNWGTPQVNGVNATLVATAISTDGAGSASQVWIYDLGTFSGTVTVAGFSTGDAGPNYAVAIFDDASAAVADFDTTEFTSAQMASAGGVIGATVSSVSTGVVLLFAAHGDAEMPTDAGAGTTIETFEPSSAVASLSWAVGTGGSMTVEQTFTGAALRATAIAVALQTP